MMNMYNEKLKKYYKELRDINSKIEESASEELIKEKNYILKKIKREVRNSR